MFQLQEFPKVKKEMEAFVQSEHLARIDYIDIVDPHNLKPIERIMFVAVICIAVKIGNTRLIDNIIVEKK